MTEYFNPWNEPYPEFGMNPGTATRDFVFAGGMAFDFSTMGRNPKADTVAAETRVAFDELRAVLEAAGASVKDIVKMTCYLSDDAYRPEFWAAYKEYFDEHTGGSGKYPSRVTYTVGIAGGCRVELDAIAVRPKGASDA